MDAAVGVHHQLAVDGVGRARMRSGKLVDAHRHRVPVELHLEHVMRTGPLMEPVVLPSPSLHAVRRQAGRQRLRQTGAAGGYNPQPTANPSATDTATLPLTAAAATALLLAAALVLHRRRRAPPNPKSLARRPVSTQRPAFGFRRPDCRVLPRRMLLGVRLLANACPHRRGEEVGLLDRHQRSIKRAHRVVEPLHRGFVGNLRASCGP